MSFKDFQNSWTEFADEFNKKTDAEIALLKDSLKDLKKQAKTKAEKEEEKNSRS